MKTGKQFKLNLNKDFRTYYGSVDYKKPKSIYLNISSWFSPTITSSNWDRVVGKLKRNIKYNILESVSTDLFIPTKQIVDLDIRTSGIKKDKRSYMNCEITLFLKREENIKSKFIESNVGSVLNSIIDNTLNQSEDFQFYPTKK
jgi:hypothetical protein